MRGHSAAKISPLVVSLLLLITPAAAFAGSQTFSTAGVHTFTVPNYTGTLTVEVWGGGGTGSYYNYDRVTGAAGGQSSWNGSVIAGGGKTGATGFFTASGGAGGIASGGDVNTNGTAGQAGSSGVAGYGGNAPNGGTGGAPNYTIWSASGQKCPSCNGSAPGGGGGGFGGYGSGGGSGAYTKKTYSAGQLAVGSNVPVLVGVGGIDSYLPDDAGKGAAGRVKITWGDAVAPPPPPPPPAPVCGSQTDPTIQTTGTSGTQIFTATGADQNFIVPTGITSINVQLKGAGGGTGCHYYGSSPSAPGSPGGSGGSTQGTLAVTPGQTLTVLVGGAGSAIACSDAGASNRVAGGYGGGGKTQNGGSGGGRSAIISASNVELVTAGGGGGGGATGLVGFVWWCTTGGGPGNCPGGSGGGINGGNGTVAGQSYATTGNGGTQTGPGINTVNPSVNGYRHNGGDTYLSNGAGGGGWYGGSGSSHYGVGGGGGGSGHCDPGISSCTTKQGGGAASDTHGMVRVSWASSDQTLSLCSAGYALKNGQCVSVDCPVCPAGQVLDANNQCVTDTTCPTGFHRDATSNACVLDRPITCIGGATLVNNVCTCPAGQHWNAAQNQCVSDNCPNGEHWDVAAGACVPNNCPAGQTWNGTQCVAVNCPAGEHWNGTACVSNNCPVGQIWNGSSCSCPAGTVWHQNQCQIGMCIPGLECGADGNVYQKDLRCERSLYEACEWGCTNATCNPPPQPRIITWKVAPTLVKKNDTTGVYWNILNVLGCTVSGTNGDLWSVIKGSEVSSPIVARTTYTLHCTPYKGATWTDRTAIVNIIPVFKEQ